MFKLLNYKHVKAISYVFSSKLLKYFVLVMGFAFNF